MCKRSAERPHPQRGQAGPRYAIGSRTTVHRSLSRPAVMGRVSVHRWAWERLRAARRILCSQTALSRTLVRLMLIRRMTRKN